MLILVNDFSKYTSCRVICSSFDLTFGADSISWKVSGMYRKYPSFKQNKLRLCAFLKSYSQPDCASIEICVDWPLRCIGYTCTYPIISLTCQFIRCLRVVHALNIFFNVRLSFFTTVKTISQIVQFIIYYSLRLIFQSHPPFAKCVSFEGSANKSQGENSTFPFYKLPNIWASCDEITFILICSFNVWIVTTYTKKSDF